MHAPLLQMWGELTVNNSTQGVEGGRAHQSDSKMNFCTLFRAQRAVLTPKTKPVKPGFLSAHKPGFTGLKMGGLPGFSGTRVPGFHSLILTSTVFD